MTRIPTVAWHTTGKLLFEYQLFHYFPNVCWQETLSVIGLYSFSIWFNIFFQLAEWPFQSLGSITIVDCCPSDWVDKLVWLKGFMLLSMIYSKVKNWFCSCQSHICELLLTGEYKIIAVSLQRLWIELCHYAKPHPCHTLCSCLEHWQLEG